MSKLDDYISKLLRDEDTLRDFLVDPIKAAEDEHELTKAQRSVLRRVVANLSNNSTNGYGVVRSMDSYRRSIRLLQNVLHVERGAAVANSVSPIKDSLATNSHAVLVYYNGIPDDPTINNPYAYYMLFYGTGDTIGEVMSNAKDQYGNFLTQLTTTEINAQSETFINGFNVPDNYRCSGLYSVPLPSSLSDRDPFWFYSVNGQAIQGNYINPNAYYGSAGYSYVNFPLTGNMPPNATVFWQVIAPDTAYGFQSCDPNSVEKVFNV